MRNNCIQPDIADKTEIARDFLNEALADFQKGLLREAAEKMTVSGTLVREMIDFIKREDNQSDRIVADATFQHRPERHVMWYELKEKYLPERLQQKQSLHREGFDSEMLEPLHREDAQQQSTLWQEGIVELDLSVRSENCLHRAGIETIGQLTEKTEGELRKIRNFGEKCLAEVKEKLAAKNLSLLVRNQFKEKQKL